VRGQAGTNGGNLPTQRVFPGGNYDGDSGRHNRDYIGGYNRVLDDKSNANCAQFPTSHLHRAAVRIRVSGGPNCIYCSV